MMGSQEACVSNCCINNNKDTIFETKLSLYYSPGTVQIMCFK